MMSIKEKIKELAMSKHMSIAELERTLDFANGSISKWDKQSPSAERLQKVAKYFDVPVDSLLDTKDSNDPISYYRIDTKGLNPEDVEDIKKQLDQYTEFLTEKLRKRESGD